MRSLFFVALLSAGCATSMTPSERREGKKFEFEQYQVVFLRRGPAWSPEVTDATKELQKQHLAHLGRMADEGKMVLAGPLSEQDDEQLRGICLYRLGSLAEARAAAEEDPAVKAGRLRVEVMTWNVEKGYVAFPLAPPLKK